MKWVSLLFFVLSSFVMAQLMPAPTLDSENRATFTIRAPEANVVKVINLSDSLALGAKEYNMVKDAEGNWSVTTNPCRPGLHYYEFNIDGARVSDPASQNYFGWGKWTSCLEVPSKEFDFYLPKDVPHGDVRFHWYFSKTTQAFRKCLVYTPPDYDKNLQARYPVLFLQHGAGESELGWTMQGKANFILDNLIAAGKAVPMIIVMDNGYAARPGSENPARPRGEDNLFADLVTNELIPMIDAQFRTFGTQQTRAIAGLSMGAGQALNIGLNHPELFSAVGGFSGGGRQLDLNTSYNGIFKDAAKFNQAYKLFFMGRGTLEPGLAGLKDFHAALTKHGIPSAYSEPVGSHEWQVWRVHLFEFAQKLFKS